MSFSLFAFLADVIVVVHFCYVTFTVEGRSSSLSAAR